MAARPHLLRGHLACWLVCTGMTVALASCGGSANDLLPPVQGGAGSVVSLGKADGGRDAQADVPSTSGGAAGKRGGGGSGAVGGGAVGGRAGAGGSAGGSGSGDAQGGAGGGGPQDDPCTACEKARCGNPVGLTSDPTESHSLLVGAYATCFLGTGWPTQTAAACIGPGGTSALGSLALSGPAAGTSKTTLCRDILECVHQTNCTGGADVDNQFQCYCGDGVSIPTCINPDFTPTGVCADQMAAGLESSTFSTSSQYFGDLCLANGAAFFLYDYCDFNCCQQQCLGAEMGGEDLTYCNAPGSGGASGTGGTTGVGGSSGTGGATHTGGTSGAGGAAGAAGNHGGGGQGVGGSTGAGGMVGAGGGLGSVLQNVHFDTSTNGWTPTIGATAVRSTNDADGSTQSGSLDLSVTGDPTIASQAAASQCFAVTAGATYNLGVKVLIPGQVGSQGGLGLWYYPSTDCSGALSGAFSSPASTTNAWQGITTSTQIPASVRSASVRLQVLKPFGQPTADALFDDVVVIPQ